jgi:biopolymer transport protein ExbD
MKIKRRRKGIFAETCASSDLAFLLIIYFLVIAGFNVNVGFLLNLPARDSTRLIQRDELMRFEMDGSGMIIYRDSELNIEGAEREISNALTRHPNLAVVLSIDGEAPWQQVVLFVELAQKLQVESFSFSMRES